jgi:hypothetical protein
MIYFKQLLAFAFFALAGSVFAQKIIFKEDFGKSTTRKSSQYVPQSGKDINLSVFNHGTQFYKIADKYISSTTELPSTQKYGNSANVYNQDIWNIDNGFYSVIAPNHIYDMSKIMPDGNTIPWSGDWWYNQNPKPVDHTDSSIDGAVLVVNGGTVLNQYYRRVVKLEPGKTYKLSAWFYGAGGNKVGVNFEAQNILTETVLGSSNKDYNITDLSEYGDNKMRLTNQNIWEQKSWVFKAPNDSKCVDIAIALRNNVPANGGNDFFVDDILLEETSEVGVEYTCPNTNFILDDIIKAIDDNIDLSTTTSVSIIENDKYGTDGTKVILSGNNKNSTIGIIDTWPSEAILDPTTGNVTFSSGFIPPADGLKYQICNLIGICSSATIKFNADPLTGTICTKSPNQETATSFTNVAVSTMSTKQENWPQSIPNGFIALESSTKGFVITRVESASKVSDAKEGMIVYDKTDNCVKLYNGTTWHCIAKSCND